MYLLKLFDIFAGYGASEILHGVSIRIKKNEIITIIGPNGAGKSTLLKVILGFIIPYNGEIIYEEKNITNLKTFERIKIGISYVPQLNNVFGSMTVLENLEMGGFLLSSECRTKKINELFDLFSILNKRKKQKAKTLSGGEKQILAMGRALMINPKLLILDEPSAGLSPKAAQIVFKNIKEINKKGVSIIIVEQDAYSSLMISDRGYVLSMGKNEFEDEAKHILKNEKLRIAFLGE